jgi:hypothetical protein
MNAVEDYPVRTLADPIKKIQFIKETDDQHHTNMFLADLRRIVGHAGCTRQSSYVSPHHHLGLHGNQMIIHSCYCRSTFLPEDNLCPRFGGGFVCRGASTAELAAARPGRAGTREAGQIIDLTPRLRPASLAGLFFATGSQVRFRDEVRKPSAATRVWREGCCYVLFHQPLSPSAAA